MKIIIFLIAILFSNINAQWMTTNGPGIAGVNALFKSDSDLFAGLIKNGVYRSEDGGSFWHPSNTGLENSTVNAFANNQSYIFAGLQSDDQGFGGVYRSSNNGSTWESANTGIESSYVTSLLINGNYLFEGEINNGIYRSSDDGTTWELSNNGIGSSSIQALTSNAGVLFAATSNNLYFSVDDGDSWEFTNGGQYYQLFSLYSNNNFIFAGGFQGLIRSTNGGQNFGDIIWLDQILNNGVRITSFIFKDNVLFASTAGFPGQGVIKSTDNGLTWTLSNQGIESVSINSMFMDSSRIIAASGEKGILVSDDDGLSWQQSNTGMAPGGNIRDLMHYDLYTFAGTGGSGVFRIADTASQWEDINNDPGGILSSEIITSLSFIGNDIFASTIYHGVFKSSDKGISWLESTSGIPSDILVLDLASAGTNLIAGTTKGIYYSTDSGNSWLTSNINDFDADELTYSDGFAYAILYTGFSATTGIYRSGDEGMTWNIVLNTSTTTPVSIEANSNYVFIGDLLSGFSYSSNFGITWNYGGFTGTGVFSLLSFDSFVFAGTDQNSQGIYFTELPAFNWTAINEGLPVTAIEAITNNDLFIFAGTEERGVWKRSFDQIIPVELISFTVSSNGNEVRLSWSTATETNNSGFEIERSLTPTSRNEFGTGSSLREGAFLTIGFVPGFGTATEPKSYSFIDENLPGGSYQYRLKQIDFDGSYEYSNIVEVEITSPKEFSLGQNYPNPFNPVTTIRYDLSEAGIAELTVYDILGREAAKLFNEVKPAGSYQIEFSANNLPSGIYFYRLQAGSFVETKKMILIK